MIDVSALVGMCFLLNIFGIHNFNNYHYYICLCIYLVHVLGLCIMDIMSVGVLDLGAA